MEEALDKRALVFVMAKGVVPVPGEPEQHANSEQSLAKAS